MVEPKPKRPPVPPEVNRASYEIIGAAIEVHTHLGPGLLESVYERALEHELTLLGMKVQRQVPLNLEYKGLVLDGQRADMIVEPGIVVELKAIEKILPVHKAQLLGYLRGSRCRLGLLINFNHEVLREGVVRMVL